MISAGYYSIRLGVSNFIDGHSRTATLYHVGLIQAKPLPNYYYYTRTFIVNKEYDVG